MRRVSITVCIEDDDPADSDISETTQTTRYVLLPASQAALSGSFIGAVEYLVGTGALVLPPLSAAGSLEAVRNRHK